MTAALNLADHDYDAQELAQYRAGMFQLVYDPPTAGQPVSETRDHTDEPAYHLQRCHRGTPVWFCCGCLGVSVGTPAACPCGMDADDHGPVLDTVASACRTWIDSYGGGYTGPCLIAGSDGCNCPDAAA